MWVECCISRLAKIISSVVVLDLRRLNREFLDYITLVCLRSVSPQEWMGLSNLYCSIRERRRGDYWYTYIKLGVHSPAVRHPHAFFKPTKSTYPFNVCPYIQYIHLTLLSRQKGKEIIEKVVGGASIKLKNDERRNEVGGGGNCDVHPHSILLLWLTNLSKTPKFECGAGKETVEHFLLNCELYDEEGDILRRRVGALGMRCIILLGDKKIIKDTMEYI